VCMLTIMAILVEITLSYHNFAKATLSSFCFENSPNLSSKQ
jgi:hypothetical protein